MSISWLSFVLNIVVFIQSVIETIFDFQIKNSNNNIQMNCKPVQRDIICVFWLQFGIIERRVEIVLSEILSWFCTHM